MEKPSRDVPTEVTQTANKAGDAAQDVAKQICTSPDAVRMSHCVLSTSLCLSFWFVQ